MEDNFLSPGFPEIVSFLDCFVEKKNEEFLHSEIACALARRCIYFLHKFLAVLFEDEMDVKSQVHYWAKIFYRSVCAYGLFYWMKTNSKCWFGIQMPFGNNLSCKQLDSSPLEVHSEHQRLNEQICNNINQERI